MTEQQFNELRCKCWDADTTLQLIRNAKARIEELERHGFKVKLDSGKDISDDLPKEAFDKIRYIITQEYRKIIEDNKKKFDEL